MQARLPCCTHVQVRSTALSSESAVSRVASMVEQAAGRQSPLERTVTKFAKYYTPLVLLAAVVRCQRCDIHLYIGFDRKM